ncbi:MAG: arginase family protein [Nanoarchaeota archaeon]|nr:arginase family protein [Nanoarchaeota archaeon]
MNLINPPEELKKELQKPQLNESGTFPVINIDQNLDFSSNFTAIIHDNHLKTRESFQKFTQTHQNRKAVLGFQKSLISQNHQNPSIIIFDAHLDALNNEDLVPFLTNIIPKNNIIIVGCREWSKDEYFFIKNNNIKTYTMKEISFEGQEAVCDAIMAAAKDFNALYISIDNDVLDQNTGGLTVRQLLYFLQRLKKLKNFKAADLAEFKDFKLMAKILRELM